MPAMPLVYAHRGGAALRPENTIEAFDHGLDCGADGLEFDVHLSSDKVVVVHHDDTLDRTTNGRGRLADRMPRSCRVPGPDSRRGTRPLPRHPDHRRTQGGQRRPRAAGDRPAAPSRRHRSCGARIFLLRSLDRGAHLRTGAQNRRVKRGDAVGARSLLGEVAALQGAVRRVPGARAPGAHEDRLADLHQVPHKAKLAVKVWTVNEADDMRRLLDWGVDALITDRPDLAVRIVRERSS